MACFHQLGVDPDRRGEGIGGALVARAERRAREVGAEWIALDTADRAERLIGWYERLGYEIVDRHDWPMTNYESVILAKRVTIPR